VTFGTMVAMPSRVILRGVRLLVRAFRRVIPFAVAIAAMSTLLATTSFAHGDEPARVVVQPDHPVAGGWLDVTGTHFPAGLDAVVEVVGPASATLGIAAADTDGYFHGAFRLPLEVVAGEWQVRVRSENGVELFAPVRVMAATVAGSSDGTPALSSQSERQLPIVLAIGAAAAVVVLSVAFFLGLFHGLAARLHRFRVRRSVDRSDDPLFHRHRRRRFIGRAQVEPLHPERDLTI
jgi:hypothetical protein